MKLRWLPNKKTFELEKIELNKMFYKKVYPWFSANRLFMEKVLSKNRFSLSNRRKLFKYDKKYIIVKGILTSFNEAKISSRIQNDQ